MNEELRDILDVWTNTDSNILISACAGSGKTTTLMSILEKSEGVKTLFLAFNKSIELEINEKINQKSLLHGKAFTLHALGLKAISNHFRSRGKSIKINNRKSWEIIEKVQKEHRRIYRNLSRKEFFTLNYTLFDIDNHSRNNMTDSIPDHLYTNVVSTESLISLWNTFKDIRDSMIHSEVVHIDFLDMIYLTAKLEAEIPVDPTYLLMDEVQDFSVIQHKMIDLLLSQGDVKKWAAVGDENQAIYGFAGSTPDSFKLFLRKSDDVKIMPLTLCYRCPEKVIEEANKVYPGMTAFKRYPGVVETITDVRDIKDRSMIICRNTKPLIDLYFELMADGRECYINGDEIMSQLLRFLTIYRGYFISEAIETIQEELSKTRKDSFEEFNLSSNLEILIKVVDSLQIRRNTLVEDLSLRLKVIFTEKDDSIMLCTIHKAKGLGRDIVYILNEDLIPSKFAKTSEELVQEENLRYVARTRAKEEMYYLNLN